MTARVNRRVKHGAYKAAIYRVRAAMIQRCHNPKAQRYASYGGRGITVCQRWRASFAAFAEDMGDRPSGATLERIDNDGNYEPGNCRWATWEDQGNNRRTNRLLTFQGRTMNVTQWAREVGINRATLGARLRLGWDIERALSQEPQRHSTLTDAQVQEIQRRYASRTVSLALLAAEFGVHPSTVHYHVLNPTPAAPA